MTIKRLFRRLFAPNYEDTERLVGAFPSALSEDVRTVASILPFGERQILASYGTLRWIDNFVTTIKRQEITVEVSGESVQIPYRVYFNEPPLTGIELLTSVQRSILHCIFLRHHDGYVRQKHLESLVGISEDFVRPFVIQLLGEYVVEILEVIDRLITEPVATEYASFLHANRVFWKRTQSRMISYWDAYYRPDFPKLNQYIGKHIADRLNTALKTISS